MIKAAIVGGTGYTGSELLRLAVTHPDLDVVAVTSRQAAGQAVADWFPHLRGHVDLVFTDRLPEPLQALDVVFFATPHATAMHQVTPLLDAGVRVIDLSADFRLDDATVFEQWYGVPHVAPALLDEAVYGLPEVAAARLPDARLVACPGCYPTAVQLALLPLAEAGLLAAQPVIADCKSGVSGAGRSAKIPMLLAEATENVKAYGVGGHRHSAEIIQEVSRHAGQSTEVIFTPHLMPMARGIHATVYAVIQADAVDVQALYEQRYAGAAFVDVMPVGSHPETRSVRGTNMCRVAVHPTGPGRVTVLSVIDNLVKGASGQAIQAMNLMFGLDEVSGLNQPAAVP
ncbi:N-acetyl-gamma-glutamyl-phosphate reductase [uncultured Abyssibacter sp.]|uniref:N-acetyl-gamma-glutamyl-phosphate reductase n=1 Tax=uncultured Abyssibacter sp. TaxID=2320202 RepID=UPI0032B12007